MKIAAMILSLALVGPATAQTIVVSVADLLSTTPNFTAPPFDLPSAINGSWTPQNPPRGSREDRREAERKIIALAWELYPDALSIRIWRGNLLIRMPEG